MHLEAECCKSDCCTGFFHRGCIEETRALCSFFSFVVSSFPREYGTRLSMSDDPRRGARRRGEFYYVNRDVVETRTGTTIFRRQSFTAGNRTRSRTIGVAENIGFAFRRAQLRARVSTILETIDGRAEKWHTVLREFCRILRIFEAHIPRGNSMRIRYMYATALAPPCGLFRRPNALALEPDEDRIVPVGMRRANSQNSCRAWRASLSSLRTACVDTHAPSASVSTADAVCRLGPR